MLDNTQSKFFNNWSREQLVAECARLNQLLKELSTDIDKVIQTLENK